jgi:RNA polymerase sigma-70 factor (ECF subfamily)
MPSAEPIHAQVNALYMTENTALVRWLVRRTRNAAMAEDIAQSTWLKVLGAISKNRCDCSKPAELRGYLYTVARNTHLDECARDHGGQRTMPIDPAEFDEWPDDAPTGDPESNAARQQADARLAAAIGRLPAEQRRVVLLWAQGISTKALSETCAAPTDTVLSRKKYAFARLRRELEPAMLPE